MPTLTLPPPESEADFEHLALQMARDELSAVEAQPYGRRGTGQSGVDHLLRLSDGTWVGLQCKRFVAKPLTEAILGADLEAAEKIKPPLARFIIATTKNASPQLQDWARRQTINGHPNVDIWFWNRIEDWIRISPERLGNYVNIPAAVQAKILIRSMDSHRQTQELLRFLVDESTTSVAIDSQSVKEAKAFLQAGKGDKALVRLQSERDALSNDPAVWRVSASAAYHLGNFSAAIDLASQARLLGVVDTRLAAIAAMAAHESGHSTDAGKELKAALHKADASERPSVLTHWLTFLLETERPTYRRLCEELTSSDLSQTQVHLPLAQAALFGQHTKEFAEHLEVLDKASPTDLNPWIPTYLRAISDVITGERAAVRQGFPLKEESLLSRISEAIVGLDATIHALDGAPASPNRTNAYIWRARAAVLTGKLDLADASYEAAIEAGVSVDLLSGVLDYAAHFDRPKLFSSLIALPQASADSKLRVDQAYYAARNGDDSARTRLQEFVASTPTDDPNYGHAQTVSLFLPFDPAHRPVDVDNALIALRVAADKEPLAIALASQLENTSLDTARKESIQSALTTIDFAAMSLPAAVAMTSIALEVQDQTLLKRAVGAEDVAIDKDANLVPRAAAEIAVSHALKTARYTRAEILIERFFPDDSHIADRQALRLRASLALQRGDITHAVELGAQLIKRRLARCEDVYRWAWLSLSSGQMAAARRTLLPDLYPAIKSARDLGLLLQALRFLGRLREYSRLLTKHADDYIADPKTLFNAVIPHAFARGLPPPTVVSADTIVVLARSMDGAEQRCIWITDRPGQSAPTVTRVLSSEPWLEPLMGRTVGDLVDFPAGTLNGSWSVLQILSGTEGIHAQLMEWAARQGLVGGGIDSLKATDDPAAVVTQRLKSDAAKRAMQEANVPDNVPIAMRLNASDGSPFRLFAHVDRPRCYFGMRDEAPLESRLLSTNNGKRYVDPLTILVAENLGIADTLLKALGRVHVVQQIVPTLTTWWWHEREHRHSKMSAGLNQDDKLVVLDHDAVYRTRGRDFWRSLTKRLTDERVVVVRMVPDDVALEFSLLADVFDLGTATTISAAKADDGLFISIDGNLINLMRTFGDAQLRLNAVSVFGVLQTAAANGTISWLECAHAKARLSSAGWSFVATTTSELVAVLTANHTALQDLNALLRDFPSSELTGSLSVVVSALEQLQRFPAAQKRAVAKRLFDALPKSQRKVRDKLVGRLRRANPKWYYRELRAWLKHG